MYKTAMLGCGGRARAHADAYRFVKNGKLAAICDMNTELLNKFGDDFGISSRYTDLDEMLEKEKPDVLHIVTAPVLRGEQRAYPLSADETSLGRRSASSDHRKTDCRRKRGLEANFGAFQGNENEIRRQHATQFSPTESGIEAGCRRGDVLGISSSLMRVRGAPLLTRVHMYCNSFPPILTTPVPSESSDKSRVPNT